MTEKRSFDAIFVGGGVIGLSCAWRAARRGAKVAVVERATPPAGATNVAAGMLAPVGELTFGEPELLELTLASARLYPDFVAELEAASGVETGYRRQGALHVALDRDEAAQLRRVHDLQRSLGLEAEWLPPRRCRELEPGLTPSFHGGVFAAGEASVDPRALTRALLAGLAGVGAEVMVGCEVSEGVFEGERLAGVRLRRTAADRDAASGSRAGAERARANGAGAAEQASAYVTVASAEEELRAGAVVLCTGAWSGQAEWLPEEARPPVRPVKGQVLELRARDGAAPCERIVASERVYLVPRPDGRLVVGATSEEQGFDTTVLAGGVHELLREAYRVLPDVAEMELLGTIAGLRPGTPDNLPLIGAGGIDGLYLATGHYRNGILLAPLTAEWLAADLAGEARLSFASDSDAKLSRTPEGAIR
ncbi:MAG TPA: FAD-dependent oxidoreductase [Solirubrobacterales bacterium]|nr:FAD-dependent oxidoreductase [Solirubrobacterales bacterium]